MRALVARIMHGVLADCIFAGVDVLARFPKLWAFSGATNSNLLSCNSHTTILCLSLGRYFISFRSSSSSPLPRQSIKPALRASPRDASFRASWPSYLTTFHPTTFGRWHLTRSELLLHMPAFSPSFPD